LGAEREPIQNFGLSTNQSPDPIGRITYNMWVIDIFFLFFGKLKDTSTVKRSCLLQGYEGYPPMTQQPMGQQYYEQQPMQPMGMPGFAPPIQAEDGELNFFTKKSM
jgi:hypothetical protein